MEQKPQLHALGAAALVGFAIVFAALLAGLVFVSAPWLSDLVR